MSAQRPRTAATNRAPLSASASPDTTALDQVLGGVAPPLQLQAESAREVYNRAESAVSSAAPGSFTSRSRSSVLASARTAGVPDSASDGYFSGRGGGEGESSAPTTLAQALATPIASLKPEQKETDPSTQDNSGAESEDVVPETVNMTPVRSVGKPKKSSSSATTPPKRSAHASTPISGVRIRPLTANSSGSPIRPQQQASVTSPPPVPAAATWSFDFPNGSVSGKKPHNVSGVFKTFFSPAQQAHPAYGVYTAARAGAGTISDADAAARQSQLQQQLADAQAVPPMVHAPMGEFPLSPTANQRVKQLDKQARLSSAKRRAQMGGGSIPSSPAIGSVASRPTTAASHRTTLGHSSSATTFTGVQSSAENVSSTSSFARRMIHAQSAADLTSSRSPSRSPPPQYYQPLSDDPDASSLFFDGRSTQPLADATAKDKLEQDAYGVGFDGEDSGGQALVPYANHTNSYASYSPAFAQTAQRPSTAASQPWSAKLTAVLSAESAAINSSTPTRIRTRPQTSSASGRRMGSSTSATALLPPELTVGVSDMPAHMQRDHAALAKLIANLEPAGRGSLASASASFSKLGTSASRDSLFQGKRAYQDPSVTQRLPQTSESDELLRKRSVQKGIENQKQHSAALASRGAAGLAGNNLNGRAVADAVFNTRAEWGPISDERPRSTRPPSAAPHLGVAAALAAAGSPAAADIVAVVTSTPAKKSSRGTSRPSTAASSRSRHSGGLTPSGSPTQSPMLLVPGSPIGGLGTSQSFASLHALSGVGSDGRAGTPSSVLGFGGSIDRFGLGVDSLRFSGSATSATGGRGMMGSKSAHKLLGQTIQTTPLNQAAVNEAIEASTSAASSVAATNKKFASLALELEVSMNERLVRIADPSGRGSKKSANSSSASSATSATAALQRLDVMRTVLDEIILHSPVFGGLLSRVKAEYESYARRGDAGDGSSNSASSSRRNTGGLSSAQLTQQQVEDTLVLENHRLHSKCHGFQRAYTSLYAKYKTVLHTQRVHQGILAQNALVLADLNQQLQAAVLASMSEEERRMERMRAEGFLLPNHTADEAAEEALVAARRDAVATLPDLDDDDDGGEEAAAEEALYAHPAGESPTSEAGRRRIHARKVARAKRAAEKAAKAQADPLERGRQLMRQFQRPPPADAPGGEDNETDLSAEGAPLSPSKLNSFLEAGLPTAGVSGGSGSLDSDLDAVRGRLRSQQQQQQSKESQPSSTYNYRTRSQVADPNDPASMVAAENDVDPLEQLQRHGRRELIQLRSDKQILEDRLLALQTQLEQSRAGELQARMGLEEIRRQKYEAERDAKQSAAAHTAAKGLPTLQQQTAPSSTVSQNVMLDNIIVNSAAASKRSSVNGSVTASPSIPPLPLGPLISEVEQFPPGLGSEDEGADDDDPDAQLVEDRGRGGIDEDDEAEESSPPFTEKESTLEELQFQREMVEQRMAMAAAEEAAAAHGRSADPSPKASASASPDVSITTYNASTETQAYHELQRKTARSPYALTGTLEEDDFFA